MSHKPHTHTVTYYLNTHYRCTLGLDKEWILIRLHKIVFVWAVRVAVIQLAQGVPGRLRPGFFLKFRDHKGGGSSVKCTGRLYPRRNLWYSFSGAELTSGHITLLGVPRKKFPATPPGIDPETVRLVSQRHNHYAIPGPQINMY